jgi:SAM-dependent methyltransferase
MAVVRRDQGRPTAHPITVTYRVGLFERHVRGDWLDCGCGDGGYAAAILQAGAHTVVGVDIDAQRVDAARARSLPNATFERSVAEELPFADCRFDGAFLNEVLEHVDDEQRTLGELHRVLRPNGLLVVMSPNRWFPFEGHGARIGSRLVNAPIPFLPWLPANLTRSVRRAENYWPAELAGLVARAGFEVVERCTVLPALEEYPWLPEGLRRRYQGSMKRLVKLPLVRDGGVSTMVVGRKVS